MAVPDILVQASAASLNVSDLLGYIACIFVLISILKCKIIHRQCVNGCHGCVPIKLNLQKHIDLTDAFCGFCVLVNFCQFEISCSHMV